MAAATAASASPIFSSANWCGARTAHGFEVLVTGCEYARDITALPAAFQNGAIYVRQDALRRWLWEKVELWSVKKGDGPLQGGARLLRLRRRSAPRIGAHDRQSRASP